VLTGAELIAMAGIALGGTVALLPACLQPKIKQVKSYL